MNAPAEITELETPIGGVQPEQVMMVWERAEPVLARVVKPISGYSLDAVLTELQLAKMQLWVIGDFQGCVVTEVQELPLHKCLFVPFLAGDNIRDWVDDWIVVMETYAKHNDCAVIEFRGRKGWNKFGENYREYQPTWTIFRRELNGRR